jgi:hypothetical protein
MIVKKRNRAELVSIVENIFHPAGKGLSSEEMDKDLLIFCLNCPDPGAAMDLVVEAPQGATSIDVVNRALAMPTRSVDTWPEADLARDHPLRHWKLEE